MPYTALDPTAAAAAPAVTVGEPITSRGMTRADFEAELSAELGGRTDVTPERILLWINWAYLDLCSSLKLEELNSSYSFATVGGQHMYAVPTAVRSTTGMAVSDSVSYPLDEGRPLTKVDLPRYRRSPLLSDEPTQYFKHNNVFVLYPTPDAARTIAVDFRIRPERLVDATDSPILHEEWHEAILLAARAKAFRALLEFDKAGLAHNDFVDFVRRREDPKAEEDEGRVVGSSIPRHRVSLRRTGRVLGDMER